MQKKLISVSELAHFLGVSIQKVYSWVSQRRLPVVKVGRRTLFDPVEIERWIALRSHKEMNPQLGASQDEEFARKQSQNHIRNGKNIAQSETGNPKKPARGLDLNLKGTNNIVKENPN